MRLMTGLLAGQRFDSVLKGDSSLSKRPMNRVIEPLSRMGARITGRGRKSFQTAPLKIKGVPLKAIQYRLPVASAQVKSAILLAGLYCPKKTVVTEPVATRDHTERFFRYTGLNIQKKKGRIEVRGGKDPRPFTLEIPGDMSSAAFLIAMAILVPRSVVELEGVLWNEERKGLIRVLKRMRANLKTIRISQAGSEKTATLRVKSSSLQAVRVSKSEVPSLIDELPILMVLATQARGTSTFRGIEELRFKETDRVASMVTQLQAMGAKIDVRGNDIRVKGPSQLKGVKVRSFGDHRTAMSFVIAGMIASGSTTIRNTDCIQTSFPNFLDVIKKAGCRFRVQR